jgi:hypothetical protein
VSTPTVQSIAARAAELTARQAEVLRVLSRYAEPVEWGDVHSSMRMGRSGALEMANFSRIGDALVCKGLVAYTDGGDAGLVFITDAGRAAIGLQTPAPILAVLDEIAEGR